MVVRKAGGCSDCYEDCNTKGVRMKGDGVAAAPETRTDCVGEARLSRRPTAAEAEGGKE